MQVEVKLMVTEELEIPLNDDPALVDRAKIQRSRIVYVVARKSCAEPPVASILGHKRACFFNKCHSIVADAYGQFFCAFVACWNVFGHFCTAGVWI